MPIPLISIVTATLNNGRSLEQTLKSVKEQNQEHLEHIVVDGESRDNTLEVLKTFEGSYNLKWISEPDKGIADALNKGIVRARGSYILVIQADDVLINPQAMTMASRLIQSEVFDIHVFPVAWTFSPEGQVIKRPIRLLWWHRFRNIFPHQGALVHRRVFDHIGSFDLRFLISMDYDFFYRALLAGCTVRFEDPPLTVIDRDGVSSRPPDWPQRLFEEFLIQDLNEKKIYWRMLQLLFRWFYFPYKIRLAPRFIKNP